MWKTRYEKFSGKIALLQAQLRELEAQATDADEGALLDVILGKPPSTQESLRPRVDRLKREIQETEAEKESYEVVREYVKAKLPGVEKQLKALDKDKEPLARKVQAAQEALAQAENELSAIESSQQFERQELLQRENHLRNMLRLVEEAGDGVNLAAVRQYLDQFREGKLRSYASGQNASLDAASRIYEDERAALKGWARQVTIQKDATLPECAKHYTKDRLREITGRAVLPSLPQNTAGLGGEDPGLDGEVLE